MVKFLCRISYTHVFLYVLILYYFFIHLWCGKSNSEASYFSIIDHNKLVRLKLCEERKLFLDFKYKKEIESSFTEKLVGKSILIDKDCRLLGHKHLDYKQQHWYSFNFYLNRKLLHSSVFGSIKLMKL